MSAKEDYVEDSLEFYIKFPPSNTGEVGEAAPSLMGQNANDYIFVYNDENVPVVLLLGWAGCQDKYLQKYSKIYEDRGLITVRYTAPISKLFWHRSDMLLIGDKILRLLYDMNFDQHPVIVHVFSNGGAYLYQHIALAIRRAQMPIQIRGMIFDSAPGERRVTGLFRALKVILGKDKPCGPLKSAFVSMVLIILWIVEDTYRGIKALFRPDAEPLPSNPMTCLMNEDSYFPQLFLYSKEDDIIPHYDVERFADYRECRGVPVTRVCFENSEHVKHYIRHPQFYVLTICKFINECLGSVYDGCTKFLTKVD